MRDNKPEVKKVIATVFEQVETFTYAKYDCPYCTKEHIYEISDENYTITQKCENCKKKFKVKVPKQ